MKQGITNHFLKAYFLRDKRYAIMFYTMSVCHTIEIKMVKYRQNVRKIILVQRLQYDWRAQVETEAHKH